jgi:hypothetical protein
MPKIKAFIKSETKENAKKCIPLVSIYINSENPEGDFGVFAEKSRETLINSCISL